MNSLEALLKSHRLLICAGSGGVGKTTMSAALAVAAAKSGLRVLVLTIDPAKRLATALGLKSLSSEAVKVPGQNFKGELFAAVVDSKKVFDEFVGAHISDPASREKILSNRLYQQLSTTLSGSQEYTSLERLYQAFQNGGFDLIILDTPPSQHAVDFLRAPQKMYSLFQSSVIQWFLPKEQSVSGWRRMLDRSTSGVFKILENLTGSAFIEELRQFFLVVNALQKTIQEHSADIHQLLVSPKAGFIVVTSFDEMKIKEAKTFRKALMLEGYTLKLVIANRAFPLWSQVQAEGDTTLSDAAKHLWGYYQELGRYFGAQDKAFRDFSEELRAEVQVLRIPDFDQDIFELQNLEMVADELKQRAMELPT